MGPKIHSMTTCSLLLQRYQLANLRFIYTMLILNQLNLVLNNSSPEFSRSLLHPSYYFYQPHL